MGELDGADVTARSGVRKPDFRISPARQSEKTRNNNRHWTCIPHNYVKLKTLDVHTTTYKSEKGHSFQRIHSVSLISIIFIPYTVIHSD